VIGEGCGIMVLEALDHAKERGAKIYAEIRGYGMSGDAHHITQPQHDGRGAILAMKRALDQVPNHMFLCHFILHILDILLASRNWKLYDYFLT